MRLNVTPGCVLRKLIVLTAIWLLNGSIAHAYAPIAAPLSHMQYWWHPATEITATPIAENWYGRSPLLHQPENSFLTPLDIRSFFAAGPIYSPGSSDQNILNPILCLGCSITQNGQSHDGDIATASHVTVGIGLATRAGQRIIFPGTYENGDSVVLDFEIPAAVLNASLLNNVRVQAYNNAALVTTVNLDEIGTLQFLGTGVGASGKMRAVMAIGGTFDRVEVTIGSVASLQSELYIYEVTAIVPVTVSPSANPIISPAGQTATLTASHRLGAATFRWYDAPTGGNLLFTGSAFTTPLLFRGVKHYYVEATTTSDGKTSFIRTAANVDVGGGPGVLWTFGDEQQSPRNTGVCALCLVTDPLNAVDGDTTTSSTLQMPVGLASSVGQLIKFPGIYQSGDSIILDLELPGQALTNQLLAGITIQPYNGAVATGPAITLDNNIARLQVLGLGVGGTSKFRVLVPSTVTFDGVQVNLTALVAGLGALRIYEAGAMIPVSVTPSPAITPYNTSANLSASIRSAGATFTWYTQPTGGVAVGSGANFTTPALTRSTNYYVQAATPDGLTSFERTLATVKVGGGAGPLWTYGDTQESPQITGVCLGCNVQDPNNAVDGNVNTSSLINMTVGALGGVSQIIHFPGTYQAGDSIALDLEIPDQLFNAQLLGGITVQTYNGSTPNPDAITLDNNLVRLQALGLGVGSTGKFRITIPVNSAFDGVKIGTSTGIAGLGALRVYEAVAFMPLSITPPAPVIASGTTATMTANVRAPGATYSWYDSPTGGTALATTAGFTTPPLTRSKTYYAEAATPDGKTSFVRTAAAVTVSGGPGPLWTYADQQTSPIIGGICIGCSVQNPNLAVDGDTTTASQEIITVGVAGSVGQLLKFPGTYQAGDSISFTLGVPAQNLSAQLLSGIRVQTFNGATPNNDAVTLDNDLVNMQALGLDPTGSVGKFRVTIPVNSTFDGTQIDLTGLVSGLTSLNVYEAAAFIPVTVTPPAPIVVPFGSDTTLTASIRVPNATFSWFDVPTGGVPLATGATFNTPIIIANKTFYVEASTPDGLKSYIRTAVPVTALIGPGSPDLSCGRGITQTSGVTGLLCLLCTVTTPELAVDDNPQTSSGIHVPVGLLGGFQQTLAFGNQSTVGDSLRIVVGSTTGLLNLSLLGNVTIRPRNNGVENAADVKPLNDGLLSLQLLDGGARQVITFAPTQIYDAVELRITGVAAALTEINLFYVQQITPMAKVVSDTVNVCSGQTATLNANAPAGATFTWYDAPSGGNLLFTGASYTTPAITADAVYYVSATSGSTGCAAEVRKPVFVKVGLASVSVTANSITIPQGGTATFNVNTPDPALTYKWYSVPTGGTALFTGTSFTTPPLNQTTTYYVEATTSTGCASAQRIAVVANVQITDPDAPCDIATAQVSSANGLCLGCYVDNQASAVDASTQTFSTVHVVVGLLGGYAQQTLIFPNPSDVGDSVRLMLSFPTSLADAGLLGSIDVATYNGAQFNNDRASVSGGGLLNVQLMPGNQQAFVTFAPAAIFDRVEIRMNAGLATALSAMNIHLAQRFVPVPNVTPDTVNTCVGSTATLNVAPRANTLFRWYNQATGGTLLFTGTTFQSGPVTTDTAFYVEAVKTSINCPNPIRSKAVVLITGAPAAPTLDNTTINTCAGTSAVIKATAPAGATFRWYAQQTGGTAIFTGDTFTTPALDSSAIYYAETVSGGGCASVTRTAVQVNITAKPATPDVTPATATICSGNTTSLTATSATPGVTFKWYSSAALDNLVFTGATFITPALTTTTNYFVVVVNGQCASADAKLVTVTVNAVAIKPTISINPVSGVVEYGQTATLTATSATPGATYRWYLDSLATAPIFTGAAYTTDPLTNNTRFFVEAVAAGGCASARAGATVLVNRNFNPGCDFANSASFTVNGLCLGCAVTLPDNAVDNDTTNVTNLSLPVGVGGNISYFMNFGSLASAGDTVKVRMAFPSGLADLSVLSNIQITSYNGATSNNDTKTLDAAGLKLEILGGANQRVALFAPGAAYDRIEIKATGLLSLLININIQYANRILSSPQVTVDNKTVCAGAQATLTATASDSTTVRWYTVPTGGTPVFTGKVFTTPALSTTITYYAESFRASTNCANPIRTSATIQVLPVPAAPQIVKGNITICAGNSAILQARPVDPTHTIRWFLSSTGGTPVSLDSIFVTGALTTTTIFYAEAYNGSCGTVTRVPVTVTVNTAPPDPVLESGNLTICSGNSATLRVTSSTTGISINWYSVQSGGTPVFTGAQFITPALSTTTIYYVEAITTAGSCPNGSGRIQAVVNVNSTPAVPVLAEDLKITCKNQAATFNISNPVTGVTYNWYSAATGGTLLFSGATYTSGPLADTSTFFVEAVGAGNCPSTSRAIARVSVVTILNPPAVESATVTVCRGAQATLRVLNPLGGVIYNWYDAPGGNKLFTGSTYLTGVQVSNSSYYVEAVSSGGCASATMTKVDVQVTDAPALPVVVGNTTVCAGSAISLSIQNPVTGLTYSWYDAAAGGTRLAQGVSFAPTGVTTTTTYYVEASSGVCSSAGRTTVTITVNPLPPNVTVDATAKTICIGNTADLHVVNPQPGLTYRWYDAATAGNIVASTPDFVTPALTVNKDYYVAAINGSNCASAVRTRVSVTVTSGPAVPSAPAEVTVCRGNRPTVRVLNARTDLQYRWYDAPIGGKLLFIGEAYTTADPLNAKDTVYVEASLPGGTCISNGRGQVILIAADAPGTPILVNSGAVAACTGSTATFNVQNPTANVSYRWYDAATGGNVLLANGTSYTTGILTANMDVYVEALIGEGCASAGRAKGTATVGPVPNAPTVTADANTICPDSSATLRASSTQAGTIFSWYTTPTGGTAVFTGPVFKTPALRTATTYYAAAGYNGGCMSATRTPVTINIYAVLPAPAVSVATKTATSVTFQWNAIPGALGYRVSANGGVTFTQPSSGLTGTTHTVLNLQPNQTVTLQVMTIGASECANSAWFQGGGGTDNPAGNTIFVPNAFTPNGDGVNDILFVYGTTIATMEIRIYNQWGQMIFESKDKARGWDGTVSGTKQPVGVYNYILRATLQDGTTVQKRGTITIVR